MRRPVSAGVVASPVSFSAPPSRFPAGASPLPSFSVSLARFSSRFSRNVSHSLSGPTRQAHCRPAQHPPPQLVASHSSPLGHGRVCDDESSALERPALGHLARLLAPLLVHLVDALRRRREDPARHVRPLDPHVVPEGVEVAADLPRGGTSRPTHRPASVR